jgi:hypothetical protein
LEQDRIMEEVGRFYRPYPGEELLDSLREFAAGFRRFGVVSGDGGVQNLASFFFHGPAMFCGTDPQAGFYAVV